MPNTSAAEICPAIHDACLVTAFEDSAEVFRMVPRTVALKRDFETSVRSSDDSAPAVPMDDVEGGTGTVTEARADVGSDARAHPATDTGAETDLDAEVDAAGEARSDSAFNSTSDGADDASTG